MAVSKTSFLIGGLCLLISVSLHSAVFLLPLPRVNTASDFAVAPAEPEQNSDTEIAVVTLPNESDTAPQTDDAPSETTSPERSQSAVEPPDPTLDNLQPRPSAEPQSADPQSDQSESNQSQRPDDSDDDGGTSQDDDDDPPSPYANFPHLDGVEADSNCLGQENCWRLPGTSLNVVRDLDTRLEQQGYSLESNTRDTGIRVFSVSKDGEFSYYLNVLEMANTSETRYIITEERLPFETLNRLRQG